VAESVPGGRAVRSLLRMARGRLSAGGSTQGVPVLHDRLVERQRRLAIAPAPAAPWGESRLSRILHAHLVRQSIPALLHYEDRNSMAFGVEARVPYLDHRIVEFALGLPDAVKLRRTWTKWPLRKVAERVLPDKVAWRRSKFGYPTPFARWLREPESGESIRELLFGGSLERRELVPADSVRAWWSQHLSGARDHSWLLYRLASIELWYRHFIDAWDPRPASVPAAARSG
jgi:asparagine synthase (glutamine-hydrolysing)